MLVPNMNLPKIIFALGFVLFLFFLPVLGYALQVKKLLPSGRMMLDDGKEIRLAGILSESEAQSTLSVILAGKDIKIEEEKAVSDPTHSGARYCYVYVNSLELELPFRPNQSPRESKMMVNEILISQGLAKVDTSQDFKHKQHFLELEALTRAKGSGLWSYEPLLSKK